MLLKPPKHKLSTIPLHGPLLRGNKAPRVALIGRVGGGKARLFDSVASPNVRESQLPGNQGRVTDCLVDVGLDQIRLFNFPSINFLHHPEDGDDSLFRQLLWGAKATPPNALDSFDALAAQPSATECDQEITTSAFAAPDVLLLVMDAAHLQRDLELCFELSLLGRPMLIALNRVDSAQKRGISIHAALLSQKLGLPVIPTMAHMGKGLAPLFEAAVKLARKKSCPLPQLPSPHIERSLAALKKLRSPDIEAFFNVPRAFLLSQLAQDNDYFMKAMKNRFPKVVEKISRARNLANAQLPRPLAEEIHADRHHRTAVLYEAITSANPHGLRGGWRHALDRFFLHPRWGLLGSLVVFAFVLFIVFKMSAVIDHWTAGQLAQWAAQWQPNSFAGLVGQAIAEGLIGLVGIVVPYMLPLVLLLVTLEETGIMHRIAFTVDRGFHYIGLHGQVAIPFLMGLGCNVPAISAAASVGSRRERVVSAILLTFVPCSARSAILLAVGGKYLGGLGVFAIFMLTLITIAVLGRLLARYFKDNTPGLIQTIPPYALPSWSRIWQKTRERTEDIVIIVTPLLILGSIFLVVLEYFGADAFINTLLTPITSWWLGLPIVLGIPILFGILRKELSLLMIYQALGTQEIFPLLDRTQIATFLVFLIFYLPCLSTFAVMVKNIGRKAAVFSAFVSLACALIMAGLVRFIFEMTGKIF